ncbi:MAG: hypothetical protein ACRC8S_09570 [Fimbriiglobus sp.]
MATTLRLPTLRTRQSLVKPGVGIAPGPCNREWGLEAGLRLVL